MMMAIYLQIYRLNSVLLVVVPTDLKRFSVCVFVCVCVMFMLLFFLRAPLSPAPTQLCCFVRTLQNTKCTCGVIFSLTKSAVNWPFNKLPC